MRVLLIPLLAAAAGVLSGCATPAPLFVSSQPTCPHQAIGPSDILVVTARSYDCRTMTPVFGPSRELDHLNYGSSTTTVSYPKGLAPTVLTDQSTWETDLAQRVSSSGPPVVYIHGYNNSQEEAVRRARAIRTLLATDRPVIAITWPSYASGEAFGGDEANNEWARERLTDRLASIVAKYPGTTLIAHSMGNRILLDFLLRRPDVVGNISQIISAAPDVDEDQFMRHMRDGSNFGRPITIYTSTKDQALALSWRVHGLRRAGDLSAAYNDHRQIRFGRYQLADSVAVVDLTDAKSGFWAHAEFIRSVPGAADLCRVLNTVPGSGHPPAPAGREPLGAAHYYKVSVTSPPNDDCERRAVTASAIELGQSPASL